jgi:acetyl-CoA carboxylase/biotin carboxylase 1
MLKSEDEPLFVVQYLNYLTKGQAPPASLSLTSTTVKLTLEQDRYTIMVACTAPDGFELSLNGSVVDVVARKLLDGSILIQVDGCSHVIHAEEEISGTRLFIDNLTCLLPNEHDPSRLQAHSPGKLVRCDALNILCWAELQLF